MPKPTIHIISGHDPSKDKNNTIMYLEANKLYRWAMSKVLPTHGFDWLNETEIRSIDLTEVQDDTEEGFILEVEL